MSVISDPLRASFADPGRAMHRPMTDLLLDSEAMLRQMERVLRDFGITAGRNGALGSLGEAPEVRPAAGPVWEQMARTPR